MVLRDHELPMPKGYTPLTIETPERKIHLLEVYIGGHISPVPEDDSQATTDTDDVYDLNKTERLVVTVLAQRYLRRELCPQPVSWKQVADDLNRIAPRRDGEWTKRIAEHAIIGLRAKLANGPSAVPGLLREEGVGEPVGNTLNINLITALLKNATLIPEDLYMLGEEL
jgi:hypothetical protein